MIMCFAENDPLENSTEKVVMSLTSVILFITETQNLRQLQSIEQFFIFFMTSLGRQSQSCLERILASSFFIYSRTYPGRRRCGWEIIFNISDMEVRLIFLFGPMKARSSELYEIASETRIYGNIVFVQL